jgi:hypothetical protein
MAFLSLPDLFAAVAERPMPARLPAVFLRRAEGNSTWLRRVPRRV